MTKSLGQAEGPCGSRDKPALDDCLLWLVAAPPCSLNKRRQEALMFQQEHLVSGSILGRYLQIIRRSFLHRMNGHSHML